MIDKQELFLTELSNCLCALDNCPFKEYRKMPIMQRENKVKKLDSLKIQNAIIIHLQCEGNKAKNER